MTSYLLDRVRDGTFTIHRGYSLRVLDGVQYLNGEQIDGLLLKRTRSISVVSHLDYEHLIASAFQLGYMAGHHDAIAALRRRREKAGA